MINLMPPNDRRQLAAARTNTLLLRYSVLLGAVIGILVIELIAMFVVVNMEKGQNEATIRDNQAKTASYAAVEQQAASFRTNLSTASYILGKQISYTSLILALANSLPSGSVISQLSLDPSSFGTPTTLNVTTTSYQRAIDVKTALQNAKINSSLPLFSSVSFQSVSTTGGTSAYPFTAVYNVTYSKAALSL